MKILIADMIITIIQLLLLKGFDENKNSLKNYFTQDIVSVAEMADVRSNCTTLTNTTYLMI